MKIIFENIEIRLINQTKGNEFGQDLRFLRKIKDRLANMVRRKVKVKKLLATFMMALVPIGYLLSSQPWHIYALQVFYAVAAAVNFPSWSAIFTRHIDPGKEAMEWGTHSTLSGIGVGIAGGIGGIAVAAFGFAAVFIFVSTFT
ncbi:MAG: hypothetical protein US72_C0018G0024, partial [Microgenomates group bacterium GW2011_GWC1_38_12]